MNPPAPEILWPRLNTPPPLGERAVHAWAVTLNVSPEQRARFTEFLSPDERERAARFRFEQHRSRFVAGRGWLRTLLAQYAGCDPAALQFTYSAHGKPALAGNPNLHFNVSHSGDLALIVLARLGGIGVDVEPIRELRDASDLVKRFFSARESALFHQLPEADRPEAFFNLWTRKESWLKATGTGISGGLNQVEVSFLNGEPARVLSIAGDAREASAWTLHAVNPAPGWAAAIAVRAREPEVSCFAAG